MSDGRYVGITIGPIYDTLLEASSPAAMWLASSMFSDMTRQLCNEIDEQILSAEHYIGKMYSPYYDRNEAKKAGAVGKYHDRIIFYTTMPEEPLLGKLEEITIRVKHNIGQIVYDAIGEGDKKDDFFQSYLQVHYMFLNESEVNGNIIKEISPYLDEMELMRTYPNASSYNPLRILFTGDTNGSNRLVRKSKFFKKREADETLGENGKNLSSIETIAKCGEETAGNMKKRKYYAFVAADGDAMGKTLEKLVQDPSNPADKTLEKFSQACLRYTEQAAQLINEFSGMTIYAGGDDLLFLAPLENKKGKSIFELCYDIQKCFRNTINEEINHDKKEELKTGVPTLSFGIAMQYYKFPLYEALAKARSLLDDAKKTAGIRKDSMSVQLTKHSGQTVQFELSNEERGLVKAFIEEPYNDTKTINSIVFAINTYRPVFETLQTLAQQEKINREAFIEAWLNLFDNINQTQYSPYVRDIADNHYQYIIKGIREAFDKWDELMCNTQISESEFKAEWKKIAEQNDLIKEYLNERCLVPENGTSDIQWEIEYAKYEEKWKKQNNHSTIKDNRLHLLEAVLRYKKFLSEEGSY